MNSLDLTLKDIRKVKELNEIKIQRLNDSLIDGDG
jgi:hypothetical protein